MPMLTMMLTMMLTAVVFVPARSREFSHRVLSITLHSFTPEQMAALEKGGNKVRHAELHPTPSAPPGAASSVEDDPARWHGLT